jgi:site-specific DNA-methyltransferase (adenine-specific)
VRQPYLDDGDVRLYAGDCVEVMAELPAESVDAVVTDPPYGLEFMGKEWDAPWRGTADSHAEARTRRAAEMADESKRRYIASAVNAYQAGAPFQAWCETWAAEALRVLKPGGHLLAFGGTRTYHRLACAIEDAGFEIRDALVWGHQRHVFCQCSPLPYSHANHSPLRGMRDVDNEAAVVLESQEGADVQSPMQRRPAGPGVGDPRAQGPGGLDGSISGVGAGQDDRPAEPGLEGRGDLLQDEGPLHGRPLRQGAGVGSPDGSGGRLHHGAPARDGDDVRLPPDADGSGASPGPRPVEQRSDEPGAMAVEWIPQGGGAWPGCPRCHLPLAPPFDAGPLIWGYGSGFPKSLDVSKAIDKAAGAEREVVGTVPDRWAGKGAILNRNGRDVVNGSAPIGRDAPITGAPATPEAARWQGWGTALKPGHEPIVVARKPLAERTVAAQVLATGTGAINVDGCRIEGVVPQVTQGVNSNGSGYRVAKTAQESEPHPAGRWPANVVLDEQAAALLDAEVGERATGALDRSRITAENKTYGAAPKSRVGVYEPSTGGPSRFFYTAKAGADERDGSKHPTVKPLALMRWLVRLVTPPGGVCLDPFAGSGTTLRAAREEGFRAIGIEREAEYLADAAHRLRQLSLFGELA